MRSSERRREGRLERRRQLFTDQRRSQNGRRLQKKKKKKRRRRRWRNFFLRSFFIASVIFHNPNFICFSYLFLSRILLLILNCPFPSPFGVRSFNVLSITESFLNFPFFIHSIVHSVLHSAFIQSSHQFVFVSFYRPFTDSVLPAFIPLVFVRCSFIHSFVHLRSVGWSDGRSGQSINQSINHLFTCMYEYTFEYLTKAMLTWLSDWYNKCVLRYLENVCWMQQRVNEWKGVQRM